MCSNLSKDSWWWALWTPAGFRRRRKQWRPWRWIIASLSFFWWELNWPHLVLLCLNLNQENLNLTRLVRHPLSSSNSSTSERGASCPAAPRNTVNVFNYQKAHSANVPRLTVPLHTLTYLSGYEGWMQFFGQNVNVSPLSGQLWSAWCLRWRRWLWPSVRLLTPPSWSRWGR